MGRAEVVPHPGTALAEQQSKEQAKRQEDELVELQRDNALEAARIEKELLAKAAQAEGREIPGALRAVADVRAKSLDGLLKLTNRTTVDPAQQDLVQMITGMASKGYLKVHASLEVEEST